LNVPLHTWRYNCTVLLNGWKQIADYLQCGVRTAQRWDRDLHLPVMRDRGGSRGAVFAYSENLNEWMRYRSASVTAEGTLKRSSAVVETVLQAADDFLRLELETGRNFAKLASISKHDSDVARRRQAARRAYDTLLHYLAGKSSFSKSELRTFQEELREFKRELEQLGEVFDT